MLLLTFAFRTKRNHTFAPYLIYSVQCLFFLRKAKAWQEKAKRVVVSVVVLKRVIRMGFTEKVGSKSKFRKSKVISQAHVGCMFQIREEKKQRIYKGRMPNKFTGQVGG